VLLAMYQEPYGIETRALGLDALSRLNLRQQESSAVWLRIREYLDGEIVNNLLPKDAMSQAIAYINTTTCSRRKKKRQRLSPRNTRCCWCTLTGRSRKVIADEGDDALLF
jgi:hypothetical protein